MIEPSTGDVWQHVIAGAAVIGSALWVVWEKFKGAKLTRSSIDAATSINNAQEQMFTLMTARLSAIEHDYAKLRDELLEERKHSRMMDVRIQQYQIHVIKLESIMRDKGLDVPEMVMEDIFPQ